MEYSQEIWNDTIRLKKRFYLLRIKNYSKDEYNNLIPEANTVREISDMWEWFSKMKIVRDWADKLLYNFDKGKIDLVDNLEQIDIINLTRNISDETQMIRMLKLLEIQIKNDNW